MLLLKNNRNKKAFTLIELLVVIAIIGILATLAVVALQRARSGARDSKRIADIKQTQTALELFFNEYNRYPTEEEWSSGIIGSSTLNTIFMQEILSAPKTADGECDPSQNNYYYEPSEDYSSYTLSFCLGKSVSSLSEGPKCATPGGILDYDCSGEYTGDGSGGLDGGGTGSNVCYPSCDYGYVCQNGSCIVDTFECGQELTYNGYTYQTVGIGTQCWFKENLKTDKFKNSELISHITGSWYSLDGPAWIDPQNNESLGNVYGKLYSAYVVLDPRGVCPEGWQVPSASDFSQLESAISPHKGEALRSCRQVDSPLGGECATSDHPRWTSSSSGYGTDIFGFSAFPAGRMESSFSELGSRANFWTLTPATTSGGTQWAIVRISNINLFDVLGYAPNKYGFSIRCIKRKNFEDKDVPTVVTSNVTNVTANKASSGGNITANGGLPIYARGVLWSENNNPTIGSTGSKFLSNWTLNNEFISNIDGLQPGKTYYIRAYAVNEKGIGYGDVITFNSLDPCAGSYTVNYDGYTYQTIGIGTQCWFKENLKTDKFRNGDNIPNITGSWSALTGPAWIDPQNNESLGNVYGKIYSAYVALDIRGICPEGWQVPSASDFSQLESAISPHKGEALRSCRQVSSPLGGECATSDHPRWTSSSSGYGTDIFGFSAFPAGRMESSFSELGSRANFWTLTPATTSGGTQWAIVRISNINLFDVLGYAPNKYGFSIRCIKE